VIILATDFKSKPYIIFEADASIKSISEDAAVLFGFDDDLNDIKAFFVQNPEFQPNGIKTDQMIETCVSQTLADGKFSWMAFLAHHDGKFLQLQLDFTKADDGNVLCTFNEIFEQKSTQSIVSNGAISFDDTTRAILDSMPTIWMFFDKEFNCIDCNDAAVELLKAKNKQEILDNYVELMVASPQPEGASGKDVSEQNIQIMLNEGYRNFEWNQMTFDGDIIPFDVTMIRVDLKDDFIISCHAQDLRMQKELEQQKALERERFKIILENSPLAVHIWDKDGNLLYFNDKIAELLGIIDLNNYKENYLHYYPDQQPDGQDSQGSANNYIATTIETGRPQRINWTLRHQNGEIIPVLCEIFRIEYEGSYAVLDFISDRRAELLREDLIMREVERFKMLFDTAPVVLEFWNEDHELIMANKAVCQLFEIDDPREFIDFPEDFSPTHQPCGTPSFEKSAKYMEEALANGFVEFEWTHLTSYGEEIPCRVSLNRTELQGKQGIVGLTIDLRQEYQKEEILNREKQRFDNIFNGIPIACTLWNEDGMIVDCNDYAYNFFGFRDKQDLINNFFDATPATQPCGSVSVVKAQGLIAEAFEKGYVEFDWMHQTLSGRPIPCVVTLTCTEIDGKRLAMSFLTDLTHHLQGQEYLRKESLRFRRFFDSLPTMCTVWDLETRRVKMANQATADFFGIDEPREYIENPNRFSPKLQPCGTTSAELSKKYITQASEGGYIEFEWLHTTSSGEEIPCKVIITKTEVDAKPALICITIDKSEERRKDNAMRKERERFELFFNLSPAGYTLWDYNRNLVMANAQVAALFDLSSPQEYIDRFAELSPPTQPCGTPSFEKAMEFLEQAFETGFFSFEWMHQKPDGTPVPTEVTLTLSEFDESPCLIGFTIDKRQQLEREAQIERYNDIFDNLPLALHIWNKENKLVFANRTMVKMLGFKSVEEYRKGFFASYPDKQQGGLDSVEATTIFLQQAFEKGHAQTFWELLDVKGEIIPLDCTLLRINYGGEEHVLEICRDIRAKTAQQRTEKEIDVAWRNFIDHMPAPSIIVDETLKPVDCNNAALQLFGYKEKVDYFENFRETLPEYQPDGTKTMDSFAVYLQKAFEEGKVHFDWHVTTKFGESLPSKLTIQRIETDNEPKGIVFIEDMRLHYKFAQEQDLLRKRLKAMVDASPSSCFIIDRSGFVHDCNATALQMFGVENLTELNAKSKYLHSVVETNDTKPHQILSEKIRKIFDKEEVVFSWKFKNASGEVIPAQISTHSMNIDNTDIAVIYAQDMREYHRYLDEVKKSQELAMVMVDLSPVACIITNEKQEILACNQAALNFFGVKDMSYMTFSYNNFCKTDMCASRDCMQKMKDITKLIAANGEIYVKEGCCITIKDETIPVEISGKSVQIAGNKAFALYITDLREKVRLEEERRKNRELIAAMLNSSPLASMVVGRDYSILSCNESLAVFLGMDKNADEFIENPYKFVPPIQPDGKESKIKMREFLEEVFNTKESMQFEWIWLINDNELVPTLITLKTVELESDTVIIMHMQDLRHIKKMATAFESMEKILNTDVMTGVYNRRYMYEVVPLIYADCVKQNKPMTIMMIDVDDFKAVNDTYGHQAGDEVLKILAARVQHSLRKENVVCRYGGEEFVVVMPKTSINDVQKTACRIRHSINHSPFFINELDGDNLHIPITISVGIATVEEDAPEDTDFGIRHLVHNADMALYKAKKTGKNRIYYYHKGYNNRLEC